MLDRQPIFEILRGTMEENVLLLQIVMHILAIKMM